MFGGEVDGGVVRFVKHLLCLCVFFPSSQLDILCNEEILGKDHTLKFVVVTRWRFKVRTFSAAAVRHVEGSSVTGAPSRLLPRDRRVFSC